MKLSHCAWITPLVIIFILPIRLFSQGGELNNLFYNELVTSVRDVELQTDGKLVCITSQGSWNQNNVIARLYENGSVDDTYQNYLTNWSGNALDLDLNDQNYGIIVGDFSLYYGDQWRYRMARLLPNGNIDLSFPQLPIANASFLNSVLIQSDNKILFSGSFNNFDGTPCNGICRVLWNGELDSTFVENIGTGFENFGIPEKLFQYPDGKILVWSSTVNFNGGIYPGGLIRLNNDGTVDTTFSVGTGPAGDSPINEIYSCDLTDDGKILLCGTFTSFNGIPTNGIVRLNYDGCVDNSLVGWANNVFEIKADHLSNNIYIIGAFTEYQGVERRKFARIDYNGNLDPSFDPGFSINCCDFNQNGAVGPETIKTINLTDNGQIILGGGIFIYDNISTSQGLISVWSGYNFNFDPVISLVGSATERDSWNSDIELTTVDGITYYSDGTIFLSGSTDPQNENTKVKFRRNFDWAINWGSSNFPSGVGVQNGANIHVTTSGYYMVEINIQTGAYQFTFVSPPPSIGFVGTAAQGWNSDVLMGTTDGKRYLVEMFSLNAGELKFRQDQNWAINWGNSIFPQSCGIQEGPNIPIPEGTYRIEFNRITGAYNFETYVSVDELDNNKLLLYPNPTNDRIFIGDINLIGRQFQIIDLAGKTVQIGTLQNNHIDVLNLENGIYSLRFRDSIYPSQSAIFIKR